MPVSHQLENPNKKISFNKSFQQSSLDLLVIYIIKSPIPIGSMYGIFPYIWLILLVNVGI